MFKFKSDYFNSLEWRQATYNYEPIKNWLVSENGIMYNFKNDEIRYGRSNNPKKGDNHQRISIKNKLYYIHRIVAEAFVKNENPEVNTIVRHLDDNPKHNHYSNLTWGTSKENTADAIRNGKIKYDENRNVVKCEEHPAHILTNDDVMKIIVLLNDKVKLSDIAKKFNVKYDVIFHIYHGDSWKYLTHLYLPFPKQSAYKPLSIKDKNKIYKYMSKHPLAKAKEILENCNLDFNSKNKSFIGYTKRQIRDGKLKLSSSTTRES